MMFTDSSAARPARAPPDTFHLQYRKPLTLPSSAAPPTVATSRASGTSTPGTTSQQDRAADTRRHEARRCGSTVSRSTGPIQKYVWKFKPLVTGCTGGGPSAQRAQKEGKRVEIAVLCDVKATLTVVGKKGQHDSESTIVRVRRRSGEWDTTPFPLPAIWTHDYTGFIPPFVSTRSRGMIKGGESDAYCSGEMRRPRWYKLCPYSAGGTWLKRGYKLKKLSDKHGPFDGWYTGAPTIYIGKVERINPDVIPGSEFFDWNEAAHQLKEGDDPAAYLKAVYQHEGYGDGSPCSGHSQILHDQIRKPLHNPRRVLEAAVGSTEKAAQEMADSELKDVEKALADATADPLSQIWSGTMWIHELGGGPLDWHVVPDITVGGPGARKC